MFDFFIGENFFNENATRTNDIMVKNVDRFNSKSLIYEQAYLSTNCVIFFKIKFELMFIGESCFVDCFRLK